MASMTSGIYVVTMRDALDTTGLAIDMLSASNIVCVYTDAGTAPAHDTAAAHVTTNPHGVIMKGCEVVPTGVDCRRFTPEKYDKKFLEKYGHAVKRVMLHVGRLSLEKRLEIVFDAMAKLSNKIPDLRLLVVGAGPAMEHYKGVVSKLGISDKVVFAGFLSDEELPVAYATCEMLVIPSTFETQGLVVLEALASGTPVVGIRYRAIPEFVHEGKNGCLFDEDSCAEAILRCLDREDSMIMSAVSSAREYSIDACTAKLENTYALAAEIR